MVRLAEGVAAELLRELAIPDRLPRVLAGRLAAGLQAALWTPPRLKLAPVFGDTPLPEPAPIELAHRAGLRGALGDDGVDGRPICEVRAVGVFLVLLPEQPRLAPYLHEGRGLVDDRWLMAHGLLKDAQGHLRPLPAEGELQPGVEVLAVADHRVAAVAVPAVAGGAAGADAGLEGSAVQHVAAVLEAKELPLEAHVPVCLLGQLVEDLVASALGGTVSKPSKTHEAFPRLLAERDRCVLGHVSSGRVLLHDALVVCNEVANGTHGHAQGARQPLAHGAGHLLERRPLALELGRGAEAGVSLPLLHRATPAKGYLLGARRFSDLQQLHELVLHLWDVILPVVLLPRRVVPIVVPLELPLMLPGHVQQALALLLQEDRELLRGRHGRHQRAHELLLRAVFPPILLGMVHVQLREVADLAARELRLVHQRVRHALRARHLLLVARPLCVGLPEVLLEGLVLRAQPCVELVEARVLCHAANDPLGQRAAQQLGQVGVAAPPARLEYVVKPLAGGVQRGTNLVDDAHTLLAILLRHHLHLSGLELALRLLGVVVPKHPRHAVLDFDGPGAAVLDGDLRVLAVGDLGHTHAAVVPLVAQHHVLHAVGLRARERLLQGAVLEELLVLQH
mmetsp:Transcript_92667/g.288924  ORF Transcript_92667/g.288924 Transcript_92667/m.288924 type:complete len:623 (-) Transcript_92667:1385-3253(-)